MAKSPDAFRTISEVADWLGIQAHVLRFWESKFTQVKPIKRAGGRRYYRPADMLLLGGIKKLLHDDGLTIKGVQKILREEGMNHVSDLSDPLDELTLSELDEPTAAPTQAKAEPAVKEPETAVVLNFDLPEPAHAAPEQPTEPPRSPATFDQAARDSSESTEAAEAEAPSAPSPPLPPQEPNPTASPDPLANDAPQAQATAAQPPAASADDAAAQDAAPAPKEDLPTFLRHPLTDTPAAAAPVTDNTPPDTDTDSEESPAPQTVDAPEPPPAASEPTRPRPRILDLPPLAAEADFAAGPAALSAAWNARSLPTENIPRVATLLKQLTALRDQMSARRNSPATKS